MASKQRRVSVADRSRSPSKHVDAGHVARPANANISPNVDVALRRMAQHMSNLPPRHIVDLLTSPSWEVGRLIKWAFCEAVHQRKTGSLPDARRTPSSQRGRQTEPRKDLGKV